MTFAETMLNFRAKYGLTQKQAAEILGVHLNMISAYEKSKKKPRPVNLIAFKRKMEDYERKMENVKNV